MSRRPILITAGGTGGHVYPALAIALELRERGVPVLWLGTRRGLEARVVPAAGIPMAWLSVSGLRGKGWVRRLLAPFMLGWSGLQALWVLLRHRPRVVVGMGGFASGPGALTAWLLRIPVVIHEQNAVAGMTNRILARFARRVLEGFPQTFDSRVGATHTGNPVRREIAALPMPEQRPLGTHERLHLLVLGGSQGAQALNEVLPKALRELAPNDRPEVWHQAGARTLQDTSEAYQRARINARVEAFIEDMAAAYAWADLVLCRSGALTVAELTAAGVGAVLVPFPHAVDDHQTANARFMSEAGAAVLLPQSELTPARVVGLITRLQHDRDRLRAMAKAARALAAPEATARVTRICLEVAGLDGIAGGANRGALS